MLIKNFKLVDSILLISYSWVNVSFETTINCFKKAIKNCIECLNEESKPNGDFCINDDIPAYDPTVYMDDLFVNNIESVNESIEETENSTEIFTDQSKKMMKTMRLVIIRHTLIYHKLKNILCNQILLA